jgi:hypothetical protein
MAYYLGMQLGGGGFMQHPHVGNIIDIEKYDKDFDSTNTYLLDDYNVRGEGSAWTGLNANCNFIYSNNRVYTKQADILGWMTYSLRVDNESTRVAWYFWHHNALDYINNSSVALSDYRAFLNNIKIDNKNWSQQQEIIDSGVYQNYSKNQEYSLGDYPSLTNIYNDKTYNHVRGVASVDNSEFASNYGGVYAPNQLRAFMDQDTKPSNVGFRLALINHHSGYHYSRYNFVHDQSKEFWT